MTMDRQKVVDLCKASLEDVMVGNDEKGVQNGKDFYKFFFTNYPDLRVYFKGAEKYTADDVQKFCRFAKQGQRILLSVHTVVRLYTDEAVFLGHIRETVNRHRQYKMDPALWLAFFTVFTGFLADRGSLTDEQRAAWMQLGKDFDAECQRHLKENDLPHV
ncbi:unnamed protein product [Caenorhabditis auriculariae]|uniref:Globin domain-containing protein n=1 Tax=Caenorhabditis auriculariae TaxID=2777116 RepID=A0A8S1GTZ6_9PELO|nr:unnamed protein product [Caenorhabditis auriculariae]